jgi:hypothetical protein
MFFGCRTYGIWIFFSFFGKASVISWTTVQIKIHWSYWKLEPIQQIAHVYRSHPYNLQMQQIVTKRMEIQQQIYSTLSPGQQETRRWTTVQIKIHRSYWKLEPIQQIAHVYRPHPLQLTDATNCNKMNGDTTRSILNAVTGPTRNSAMKCSVTTYTSVLSQTCHIV